MTKPQEKMLLSVAAGADVNVIAQVARITGGVTERRTAQTILALYKQRYLEIAKGGGLEISAKGVEAAAKLANQKETK